MLVEVLVLVLVDVLVLVVVEVVVPVEVSSSSVAVSSSFCTFSGLPMTSMTSITGRNLRLLRGRVLGLTSSCIAC